MSSSELAIRPTEASDIFVYCKVVRMSLCPNNFCINAIICYTDFNCDKHNTIVRDTAFDEKVVRKKLTSLS